MDIPAGKAALPATTYVHGKESRTWTTDMSKLLSMNPSAHSKGSGRSYGAETKSGGGAESLRDEFNARFPEVVNPDLKFSFQLWTDV